MQSKSFSFLITIIILFSSCSKEDEFKTISPTNITFVHEDGSAILLNECIKPNINYAVLITTKSEGTGIFKTTKVEYTLNGVPYIMSFSSDGKQSNKIKLVDGINQAEIVGSYYKAYLYFGSHDNFELVE
ncbi:hypothetical protein ACM55K_01695 [Flavobacterium sp. LT1R49]|uniref:hypothetical protein n=1 Tax=Flavobacterium arabinosi TaxID=3398737 RepID=UPI003A8513C2